MLFCRLANIKGKSLVEHFLALPSIPETTKSSISSSVKPTLQIPSFTAIVAGTAPLERIIFEMSFDSCLFSGYGNPWLKIVDSSATTGLFVLRATLTSGRISTMFSFEGVKAAVEEEKYENEKDLLLDFCGLNRLIIIDLIFKCNYLCFISYLVSGNATVLVKID